MNLAFQFEEIAVTEFGVGLEDGVSTDFVAVPADANVQSALLEMAQATWNAMRGVEDGPAQYDPGEKHGSTEYLLIPAGDTMDVAVRELHDSEHLRIDGSALEQPDRVLCYFARFTDGRDQRLTAVRRASQFKGILRSRVVVFGSDTLRLVEDKVFKLDSDFDLLLDSERTHIWRPSGFEFLGGMKQEILNSVPKNVASIEKDLPFVDFDGVERYAAGHSRAARYLASIRTQNLGGMARDALVSLCRNTGVEVEERNGQIAVRDGQVMGLLEVLDRRRYRVELVPGAPERFKAASRRKLDS